MIGWHIIIGIVTALAAVLWIAVGLVMLWHVVIAVFGCAPPKPRKKIENKTYRFAVIVCARNEQDVIGNLIDSLHQQEYPRDSFTVFVTADNCSDRTAEIAKEHGAEVYVRSDLRHVGKGYALHWTIDRLLSDYPGQYDALTVFDADNVVDPQYLRYTNDALCTGADATQGYRESKNPFQSVVSGCYTIYWYMLSRFYHQARSNKGMSCSIGGTGFAFKTETVARDGWVTKSLTEDSEFASRLILKGRYVQFVRDALFYDEQPVTWGVSFRQRRRWMTGTVQEARLLLRPAVQALCAGNRGAFDVIMFLLGILCMALVPVGCALSLLASLLTMIVSPAYWLPILGGTLLGIVGGCYGSMFLVALLSVVFEKHRVGKFWPAVLAYPVFMLPMTFFVLCAIFRKDIPWEPIAHRDLSTIDEISANNPGASE